MVSIAIRMLFTRICRNDQYHNYNTRQSISLHFSIGRGEALYRSLWVIAPAVKRTIMQSPYDIGLQLSIVKLHYFMSFLILHYMPLCLNK